MNETILLALFFCHFLADYTHLSTPWMLGAKRLGKPLIPIFIHASVHAFLMLVAIKIILIANGDFRADIIFYCAAIQLITHFAIDVLKGRMNVWVPVVSNPANKFHWWLFGFDQYLHAIVIIFMTYIICK